MLISLQTYLEEVIDVNDRDDLLTMIGQRVMYRYHRKSKKVYGKITELSIKTGKVYVVWEDKQVGWYCITSVEVVI